MQVTRNAHLETDGPDAGEPMNIVFERTRIGQPCTPYLVASSTSTNHCMRIDVRNFQTLVSHECRYINARIHP